MRYPSSPQLGTSSLLHSRFEAVLYPLRDEAEVGTILDSFKKKHPKADHYPYAYVFEGKTKSSDDGEPGGSAGKPYMEILTKNGIEHALIVCARYFGGTKLGVGNLRRCFVEAALDAVHQAEFWTPVERYCYTVSMDYSTYDTLKRLSPRYGFYLEKEKFDERVETRLVSSDKLNKTWEEMGLGAIPLPEPERVTQLEKWSSNDHSK